MFIRTLLILAILLHLASLDALRGAESGRTYLSGHVPKALASLTAKSRLPADQIMPLSIGLPLRNQDGLDQLLQQIYDPASTNFHKYLTPQEFTVRFGPTEQDYAALQDFVRSNGLQVVATHPNRVVLDISGPVGAVERVFAVTLRTYQHPQEAREFFAPDIEPSVSGPMKLLTIGGLDNYSLPRPHFKVKPQAAASQAVPYSGSGPSGTYRGNDFRAAYVPGTTLTGAGQSVGLLQYDGYYSNDIASYISQAGIATSVVLSNIPAIGNTTPPPGSGSIEVSLDIEMVIAMAPGLKTIYVYEVTNGSTSWFSILNHMANDNLSRQLSSSWGGGSPDATSEQVFKQMASQGQTFFNASGDSDAFTGSVPFPSDSTNITQVGGTTLTTSGAGGNYVSETVWNWGNGQGSSGGLSTYYKIPYWQTNLNLTASGGSSVYRNIPDVALTADNVNVIYSNGVSGVVGGTSCAAPLWAGFTALINQQAALASRPSVGFLNPAIYNMAGGSAYATNFHDITTGNNTSIASPSKYYAVAGYDLCTGLGTPNGTNFINALAPLIFAPVLTPAGWSLLWESATPTNGAIDPGETVTISIALQNQGNLATTNLIATLLANNGVLSPSGSQIYGALAGFGAITNQSFTITASGACGSNIVAVLQLQDGTNNLGTVSVNLPLGKSTGLTQNFDAVTAPALPANWTSVNVSGTANPWSTIPAAYDTAPNAAFVSDSASSGQNALVSQAITINSTNAQLSFRHNFSFEFSGSRYYDGGVLEIQIGNGAFTDIVTAGGSMLGGGYNKTITTRSDNPIGGRSAWCGNSGGWQTVNVKLPVSAAGKSIQLRWNCATDTGNTTAVVGWYVDSINISDAALTCLPVLTDLAVSQSMATNSLQSGQNLIYNLAVTNSGPQLAANIALTDTVPANVTFVSASPGATNLAGKIVFPIGLMAVGSVTNFALTLAPTNGTVFTNFASVGTITPETNTTNNFSSLIIAQINAVPAYLSVGLMDQMIQCGSNANFMVTPLGTPPLSIQWSLDGMPVFGATNTSFSLTNLHLPNHVVSISVTNLFGSMTSNSTIYVQDTIPPIIALNGSNSIFLELWTPFIDPGASSWDTCAGVVPVVMTGTVNPGSVGTNILKYLAQDGNGNTNIAVRTVIVRDTTPPAISWTFTNLVLAADTNCGLTMPDVTGTNFILATDLSAPLTLTQNPTNTSTLSVGTNAVVITVKDAFENASVVTNTIVVVDQTPPQILMEPQSQTNFIGAMAGFSVVASACTPLTWQWFFNDGILPEQTNSTLTYSNVRPTAAGNYFVVVSANGGSSTSTLATLTLERVPAVLTLDSSSNPSGYRSKLNFTASVTPVTATGTIQWLTNGALFNLQTVQDGFAESTSLALLPRGTNTVTAIYSGDASDLPQSNSILQIITNHPPAASPAFFTRNAGLPLTIPLSSLATNWSDLDNDPVFLGGINTSTDGVNITNDNGIITYSNSNNVNDQFVCSIHDDFGGTNFQVVNIGIVFPAIASVAAGSDGNIQLNLKAAPGHSYILETRTDLLSGSGWLPVATNIISPDGYWLFNGPQWTNFTSQFYRLELEQ